MRILLIILMFCSLPLFGQNRQHDLTVKNDSILVDSKYGNGVWSAYFKTKITTFGRTLKLKIVNESSYIMQWGDSLNLKTYPDTFSLDEHSTWIPRIIDENKDYIVMRQGCGNPCWTGYFLPLDNSLEPEKIQEYLDYDLNNNLIAFIKDVNIIEIVNIKTGQTENHWINGCTSAFLGYCIDSLSIKNRTLKYKWIPDTYINSQKGDFKTERIKI